MELMQAIAGRKSVRSYTGEKISREDLAVILQAANASPVGKARYESLHLTVVENPELLKGIDQNAAKAFGNPQLRPLYGAPTLIVVSSTAAEESLSNVEYSNAAIMVHNMTYAAIELGVGSCCIWGAIRTLTPALTKQLELPKGFAPCCGIILGATTERYTPRDIPGDRLTVNTIG